MTKEEFKNIKSGDRIYYALRAPEIVEGHRCIIEEIDVDAYTKLTLLKNEDNHKYVFYTAEEAEIAANKRQTTLKHMENLNNNPELKVGDSVTFDESVLDQYRMTTWGVCNGVITDISYSEKTAKVECTVFFTIPLNELKPKT